MNHTLLMEHRVSCFKKILTELPPPAELPAELLVMSSGTRKGSWSYRHVYTEGETMYFIFRKYGLADGLEPHWECVDRDLDELMQAG